MRCKNTFAAPFSLLKQLPAYWENNPVEKPHKQRRMLKSKQKGNWF